MLNYLLLFLHFIALPAVIIYALIMGEFALAAVNGAVFLLLFIVWKILKKK